jgi:hypothetical protein
LRIISIQIIHEGKMKLYREIVKSSRLRLIF